MKKFINTLKDIFSIKELKQRIVFTLAILLIYRLGTYIVIPGVDPVALKSAEQAGGIFGFIDIFLGGAFSRVSIFALGIMPYISASIVIQLLGVAMPAFQKLQKEGESGRKKITQWTRWLTIAITAAQGFGYIQTYVMSKQGVITTDISSFMFMLSSLVVLTTGTLIAMWLGEKITERGIGNGISLLIMVGIIAQLPGAIVGEFAIRGGSQMLMIVLEFVALFFIVMAVVLLTQAVRKIPIEYAGQVAAASKRKKRTLSRPNRSYIPIKVNSANVMPIIFAQSLMFIPPLLGGLLGQDSPTGQFIMQNFQDQYGWLYNSVFAFLIIVFTFFYTAITINPAQISENLRQSNALIPGVPQGKPTEEYIANVIDKITLPGAIFLAFVAILPAFAVMAKVTPQLANFYGGTSLIILVGVVFDTLQQIESYLLMQKYEGMMKTGNVHDGGAIETNISA